MSTANLRIEQIQNCLYQLETVKRLGRENSRTLGLFPDGAFDDYAAAGTILVTLDDTGRCLGYLLYRVSRDQATIVHLCVDPAGRKQGIASGLVRRLIELTQALAGIGLKCRRDYPANDLWPKLGFTLQNELRGRGKDGMPLIFWWRANRHTSLFSEAAAARRESSVSAVIDTNILFDLHAPEGRDAVPSLALRADWLQGALELFVTDEVFNEINRQPDPAKRRASHDFAKQFPCLSCEGAKYDVVVKEVRALFPTTINDHTAGDVRQVARAVAVGATYFLTRDTDLAARRDEIQERFGLVVLHPTELISRFDEYRRASEYEPVKFAGTSLHLRLLTAGEIDAAATLFQCGEFGEKKAALSQRMRALVAEPDKHRTSVLVDSSGTMLAVVAVDTDPYRGKELLVPLLRVSPCTTAATVARLVIRHVTLLAARSKLPLARVTDTSVGRVVDDALFTSGYGEGPGGYQKFNVYGAHRAAAVADIAESLRDLIDTGEPGWEDWVDGYREPSWWTQPSLVSAEEHTIWPGKLADGTLNNYIVPIDPRWAEQLFDEGLAAQSLFGRNLELALNSESVYYRALRGPTMTAPARLLWYVSEGNADGAKRIRACSRLEEVRVGPPKDLFREFRRLGVFSWEQVFATAGNDVTRNIVALRFTDTELFSNPIPFQDLQRVLHDAGNRSPIISPIPVSADVFLKLYGQAAR